MNSTYDVEAPVKHPQPTAILQSFGALDTLAVFYLFGCVLGSLIGCFGVEAGVAGVISDFAGAFLSSAGNSLIFGCAALQLLILLSACSALGVLVIPAAFVFYGSVCCCCAGNLISGFGFPGVLTALAAVGLPALIQLPCMLYVGAEGLRLSSRLIAFLSGSAMPRERRGTYLKWLLASAPILFEAVIIKCVVPPILNLLANLN